MKKQINSKRITSIALVLIMFLAACTVFSSCGATKEDIVGTWKYTKGWTTTLIIFFEDGTYGKSTAEASLTYSSGSFDTKTDTVSAESGTYIIRGNKVQCTSSPFGETTMYEYSNGELTAGGITFTKTK